MADGKLTSGVLVTIAWCAKVPVDEKSGPFLDTLPALLAHADREHLEIVEQSRRLSNFRQAVGVTTE